jgi:hypothetical protein
MIYNVYVPIRTSLTLDYKFDISVVWASSNSTTISSQNFDDVWVKADISSSVLEGSKQAHYEGTKEIFNANDVVTAVVCTNAYAASESYTKLYKIGLKYRGS